MKKRFKTKRKNKILKIISIILIIYITYSLSYSIIYNRYLKKLSNIEIIEHIIENTKNSKTSSSLIEKYTNPKEIIKQNFKIEEKETLQVVEKIETEPLIYIYSTHETESYSDKHLELYNIKPTVKTMSYILQDYLSDLGINTIVEKNSVTNILKQNNWSYKHSYEASKILAEKAITEEPQLKLVIDLHRDSSKLEKTLLETQNKKYARILFVIGGENKNFEENYTLSEKLEVLLENEVKGISRGIIKKSGTGVNGIYNQDLSSKIILIELGGQYNEIEELNNTIKVLAKVILKYIEGE